MRVAVLRSDATAWARRQGDAVRRQWRPVVLPGLVLWALAAYVAGALLRSFDVSEYQHYAHAALQSPLLHHFPNEYPAPALVVFLLPLLLPLAYPWAFAVPVGIVLLVLLMSYDSSGVPGMDLAAAGRLIIYLALGEVMVLTSRYDLFAAAAAFWALRAARRDRWSAAWTWSSIGFLLKIFPAALWPVLLIAEWRSTGRFPTRRLWWMLGSFAMIVGLPALFEPPAATNVLHYYLHRPAELGSIAAGISLLADWHGWHWVLSYHSMNVRSPVVGPFAAILELGAVAGCVAVWWAQWRDRLSMQAACLVTLSLVVLGGKVFSVQYLMWLMPFWALYRLRVSWALACIANTAVFPFTVAASRLGFVPVHGYVTVLTLTYLARDVLVLVGTVMWLREVWAADSPVKATVAAHSG